jgi:hypothetical protein
MDLEEVIKNIEEDQLFTRGITSKIFKSMLNQPSLVSVNSANAVKTESENGYYTFKIDFARPILDVDTIQLLTTSIPQANASIPNTAITFWYYRLSQYTGTTPSLNNLYCVRLLPSYYKPEFIVNPTNYGWNKTFPNYTSLSGELAKSCVKDLGYENLELLKAQDPADFQQTNFPILPGDITIAYNSTYNKFQMTGNTTQLAYVEWSNAITYAQGAVVYRSVPGGLGLRTYTSLVNANLNNNPLNSPTFWKRTYNEIVAEWNATTLYQKGNIVAKTLIDVVALYRAKQDTLNNEPPNATYWENFTSISPAPIVYNYLITGYDDPNVAIRQGPIFQMPYNPTRFYQSGERVKTDGRVFEATTTTSIFTPGNVDQRNTTRPTAYYLGTYRRQVANQPIQNWTIINPNPTNLPIWSQYQPYKVGDLVYSGPRVYKCLIPNTNAQPTSNFTNGLWILQAQHPYNAVPYFDPGADVYNPGDCATYQGQLWVANISTNDAPAEPNWTSIGREVWQNYNWDGTDLGENAVVYFNGTYYEQNDTTFNGIPPVLPWSSDIFYAANTLVQNDGLVFRCVVPNQAVVPLDVIDNWSAITLYEVGQTAIINNIQYVCKLKNLSVSPANPIGAWNNVGLYAPFNIVFVAGVGSYRAINSVGPSATPPNSDLGNWEPVFLSNDVSNVWEQMGEWEELGDSNWNPINDLSAEVSGLYGLSRVYDFVEQYENTELVNFPNGVGGQPFNIAPERLLNSILGFTWNGIFNPSSLTNLPTNELLITIKGGAVSLYNRMRPVPTYKVEREVNSELFRVASATATRTYTAEGYANLVYSSIVNIYTNVIGGSTLDTIRNTNLVATTSMNCGNLGIAFHGNYIDTPLQRVAGDINELTIELRDEVGEPFYLTNNAIMTATFKVTYKDGGVRIEEPA